MLFEETLGEGLFRGWGYWMYYHIIHWRLSTSILHWELKPSILIHEATPDHNLDVEIECKHEFISDLWTLDTVVEMSWIHVLTNKRVTRKLDCHFNNHHSDNKFIKIDFGKVGKIMEAIAPNCIKCSKSVDDLNQLKFQVDIQIKGSTVQEQKLPISYFWHPQNNDSEVVVRFEDHKFYVDKYVLICFSSVFREQLSNGANEVEISLSRKHFLTVRDVISFLRLFYRQQQNLASLPTTLFLELATKYDVQFMISDFEEFFISYEHYSNYKKMFFAEKYGLSKLQEKVLEVITINDINYCLRYDNVVNESFSKSTSEVLSKKRSILKQICSEIRQKLILKLPPKTEF